MPENNQETLVDNEVQNKSSQTPMLSKRALKRLQKAEKWEATKSARRAKEREKRKLKRKDTGRSLNIERKRLKETTMSKSDCKVHVVIDLSFDEYMADKDIAKCVKQIHRSYSLNRRVLNPVQFHVTSLNGKSFTEMERKQGYQNWDVYFHKEHFSEVLPKENIVYLTSESDNEITALEDDKAYIIGGLVDHNAHKGLCHKLASENGYAHARLPLDKFLDMKTRKVLTIDQVFHILALVANKTPWPETLLTVLPPRKGACEKTYDEKNEEESTRESEVEENGQEEKNCERDSN